ncbi:MAG: substrate-binding domain-containing protein [Dethiobacter sp.]|jgi:tungstate transport system substrate-binding protein|nr:substrate-binding domain-containing protein [Dethiobacter sp.]
MNWEVSLNLGERIPGRELLALLEKIDDTGSLNRAVEEAGFSYRYGWGLLNRAEEALGKALVIRQAGGSAGGGTRLTPEGRKLLGHMQSLQREVQGQLFSLLAEKEVQAESSLVLASTMEPVVTGLLDVLEQAYLQETSVIVRHIAAGSGQAIAMAKAGRVDVLLTHAPALEKEFVSEGWGVGRTPVMSNDFIIVGPQADPAAVASSTGAADAFGKIATAKSWFVSRGDKSGTHLSEKSLWQEAGIDPSGQAWYLEVRNMLGNYGIMRRAAELCGYTLVDRASFVAGIRGDELKILLEGDPLLQNIFSVIAVSRKKAAVNQEEAEKFCTWLSSPAAAKIISGFGRQQFGFPLFVPVNH